MLGKDDNLDAWFQSRYNQEDNKGDSGVQREEPNQDESTRQFVSKWQSKIRVAKKYFEDDFKRMREDMTIARQGATDEWVKDGNYTVPVVNRYLNQSVASLYAKNPTPIAERRKTLDFKIWDGKPDTAMAAYQNVQNGDPASLAMLQDIEQGRTRQQMIDRIGKSMEIAFNYFANEQKPKLKPSMKSLVRRAKTCGVGYVMLGFQRQFAQLTPDETATLADARNQMGELQRRMQDFTDGEIDSSCESEMYELKTLIEQLGNQQNKLLREGPIFMFPKATEIIIDPSCRQLTGFIGAGWIAREFHKSKDDIQKIYNVDIKAGYTPYKEVDDSNAVRQPGSEDMTTKSDEMKDMVCIWEVYNKDLGQVFTIADGYNGFLKPAGDPDYWMEGFWPIFAITFNEVESEKKLYPLSDVFQLKHVQNEYNRSRQYRRLHREANKPKYAAIRGRLSENDKKLIESAPAHAVVEFDSMGTGEKIGDIIQRFESIALDPALYETNSEMDDILRTVGAQEANVGGLSGGTATESSIAESSRMTSLASNIDDLDEFLSDLVCATGQLMLMELSVETIQEIAGVGAVWPELNREQIAKEILLKVRAGSSGRPNKAAELANMERGMPYILQLPGVNPYPLAKRYADLLDIDLEDIVVEGLPSITAINAQMTKQAMGGAAGAGAQNDPNAQGAQGANNAPKPAGNEAGPQPSYQTPAPGMA